MKRIVRFLDGHAYWPPFGKGMFVHLTTTDGKKFEVRQIQNISFDTDGYPTRIETLNTIYVQVPA